MKGLPAPLVAAFALCAPVAALAADYPAPKEGEWVVRDFRFHTGEALPELRLHYTTIGDPKGEPVVVLHGTAGSASSMLTAGFAGELFPRYNYDDMVDAHHRLLTEGLGIERVRLVIGNSMGGMETWMWAAKYPGDMDIAVPMASLPTEMASRNWMMRRLIVDSIRNDPEWMGGNYTKQPKSAQFATVFELGILDREVKRVKNGRVHVIPASEATSGHGTTGSAKFYAKELREVLQSAPKLQ